jgi:hypothetical protein
VEDSLIARKSKLVIGMPMGQVYLQEEDLNQDLRQDQEIAPRYVQAMRVVWDQ